MNNRVASVALSSLVIACSSSTPSGSGPLDASPGSDARSGRPDATTDGSGGGCTSDSQCATFLANLSPTPAGCAEAYCDTSLSRCAVRPVDHDQDTYRTAACSVPGVSFTPGTDCNDNDPNLYPGHPESCDTGPDGGPPPAGFCAGQLTCLADGTESPCTATVTCLNQACSGGACVGVCAPGQLQCASTGGDAGSGAALCSAAGMWTPPGPAQCADPGHQLSCSAGVLTAPTACVPGQACCADVGCTDEQTDTNNCGACGHRCAPAPSTGYLCLQGSCFGATLASGQYYVSGIAVDTTTVYWTTDGNPDDSFLLDVPIGGGTPRTLASGVQGGTALAVDAMNVYFTSLGEGHVVKVPIGGGTATTLASGGVGAMMGGIAVDATSVYWSWSVSSPYVMKVAIGGGALTTLAQMSMPGPIVVDATNVYWADILNLAVMDVPIAGGTPTTLASSQDVGGAIAVDATNVYWLTSSAVMKLPLVGGIPTTLAAGPGASSIAVDATNVYWTAYVHPPGAVMKVPIGGGAATTLASDPLVPTAIAVDATYVYWGDQALVGNVTQLPK